VDKLADKKTAGKNTKEATPLTNKKVKKNKAAIETITTAGGYIRNIAAGTEFYSNRARKITKDLIAIAQRQKPGFSIKDEPKLLRIAAELGIQTGGRPKNEIAVELGELILNEFNKQEGELLFLKRAPRKRQEIWRKLGVAPSGIDYDISAIKKLTDTDGDQNLLLLGWQCSLANGWGSNMIAAELQDIMSGTPSPALQNIDKSAMVTGFSPEAVIYSLGGSFRSSLRPLIDNIINGRIRGIAALFNCGNGVSTNSDTQVTLVKELIKNDVLVLFTGDDALPLAKSGLMVYEGAQYAGDGLHSVCEAVGLPPVLHMGTAIDNCRILITASALVKEGKLGDISDLPACIASLGGINEKALAIGQCFVCSGFYTVSGDSRLVESKELTENIEKMFGGIWDFETDPTKMAQKMIALIDKKRKALGIDKARERVLYDMAMRRELI
jgi:hydroxylamine reductase (hybrid-cluster protein)